MSPKFVTKNMEFTSFFQSHQSSWKRYPKILLKAGLYLYLLWSSKFGISNAISCKARQGGDQIWRGKNWSSLPSLQWTPQSPTTCPYVQDPCQRKEKIGTFWLERLQLPLGIVSCLISSSGRSESFPWKTGIYHIISSHQQPVEKKLKWVAFIIHKILKIKVSRCGLKMQKRAFAQDMQCCNLRLNFNYLSYLLWCSI